MAGASLCVKPIRVRIDDVNRYLRGWRAYFSPGDPRGAFRTIGGYVRER